MGIHLNLRIRNWSDLKLLKPTASSAYEFIEPLFKGVADWAMYWNTHWEGFDVGDAPVKAGKPMPSTLLKKLNSYSGKSRLYKAFQALGNVTRTLFLLRYVSEPELRQETTACTNKVGQFNHFVDWVFFAKAGVITDNDPLEQEERLHYLDLVVSPVSFCRIPSISHKRFRLSVIKAFRRRRSYSRVLVLISPAKSSAMATRSSFVHETFAVTGYDGLADVLRNAWRSLSSTPWNDCYAGILGKM